MTYEYRNPGVVIPSGTFFFFSSGEYSDYSVDMFCEAFADIDVDSIREEYLNLYPDQKVDYQFKKSMFLNWVVNVKKLVREIPVWEFLVSGYSTEYFKAGERDERDAYDD